MVEKDELKNAQSANPLWSRIVAMLVSVVLVAAVFIAVSFYSTRALSKRQVPHIIFILADDLVSGLKKNYCFFFPCKCSL